MVRMGQRRLELGGSEVGDLSSETMFKEAVDRAAADIAKYGWHIVAVQDDDMVSPGFLYTVGLWETYQHPELLLYAPQWDPSPMAGNITSIVGRIAGGESFVAGSRYPGPFRSFSGAFRRVDPAHYGEHFGVAGAYYQSFDFPALQLFWPDRNDKFPWEAGFESVPAQPLLDQ